MLLILIRCIIEVLHGNMGTLAELADLRMSHERKQSTPSFQPPAPSPVRQLIALLFAVCIALSSGHLRAVLWSLR